LAVFGCLWLSLAVFGCLWLSLAFFLASYFVGTELSDEFFLAVHGEFAQKKTYFFLTRANVLVIFKVNGKYFYQQQLF
jgi:hypothetical protein